MPDPTDPGLQSGFTGLFGLVAVIVVLGIVASIGLTVYRAARLRAQGVNPLTVEQDLAAKVLKSDLLGATPSRSKAERLAELDVLVANGTISATERDSARARILAD